MAEPSEGMEASRPRTRPNTLRQAASAVFALTAIVPLLLFVWTVHEVGALSHLRAQVALGLALAVALVGFSIFRRLMGQMSDLILTLGRVLDLGERAGARAQPRAPNAAAGPSASPASLPVRPSAPEGTGEPRGVPGLGAIQEVHDPSSQSGSPATGWFTLGKIGRMAHFSCQLKCQH